MEENTEFKTFLSQYLERGFGSMNKTDFEVWIFHYLMNHDLKGMSNYAISIKLRINETKVKRLRYEAELKYNAADSLANYHRVCELLTHVHFKKGGKQIQFAVEDLYLRKYLDSTLKSGGRFSDSSFNSEIVSLDYDDLEFFLGTVPEEKAKLEKLLTEVGKKRKVENLSFKDLLEEIRKSSVKEIGKQLVDLSIPGVIATVKSLFHILM